ncbi:hypothetical protein VWY06_01985 [Phaeobacter sp. JH20_10]|uniref:hypothetical protein n=1 Tax=Phaeobacter sp. JH20_10 TaxID=3112469 RepID=UPI003A839F14
MENDTQASGGKHDAAYETAPNQPQNQGDEPTPDKLESTFIVDPKCELACMVLRALEKR